MMVMLTSRFRIFCAKSTTEMLIRSFLIGGIFVFLYELKKVKNGVNMNPTPLSKNAANLSSNSIVWRFFSKSISNILRCFFRITKICSHCEYSHTHTHWFGFSSTYFFPSIYTYHLNVLIFYWVRWGLFNIKYWKRFIFWSLFYLFIYIWLEMKNFFSQKKGTSF